MECVGVSDEVKLNACGQLLSGIRFPCQNVRLEFCKGLRN